MSWETLCGCVPSDVKVSENMLMTTEMDDSYSFTIRKAAITSEKGMMDHKSIQV
jgi:hypothetical protein